MSKQKTRLELIKIRNNISFNDFTYKNQVINNKVFELISEYKTVGIYVSKEFEVDTIKIINKLMLNKIVCVPKVNGETLYFYILDNMNKLKSGKFNVLEPIDCTIIDINQIDVMIIPLVGFDALGNRMGYGAGFYDRALCNYHNLKIALAFSEQKLDKISVEQHDILMDIVISDEMIYRR